MLDFITDSIVNVLDVVEDIFEGELPSKRQVAKLIADGMTITAIAAGAGVAESVIEELTDG